MARSSHMAARQTDLAHPGTAQPREPTFHGGTRIHQRYFNGLLGSASTFDFNKRRTAGPLDEKAQAAASWSRSCMDWASNSEPGRSGSGAPTILKPARVYSRSADVSPQVTPSWTLRAL